jgi:hypothetical protein
MAQPTMFGEIFVGTRAGPSETHFSVMGIFPHLARILDFVP